MVKKELISQGVPENKKGLPSKNNQSFQKVSTALSQRVAHSTEDLVCARDKVLQHLYAMHIRVLDPHHLDNILPHASQFLEYMDKVMKVVAEKKEDIEFTYFLDKDSAGEKNEPLLLFRSHSLSPQDLSHLESVLSDECLAYFYERGQLKSELCITCLYDASTPGAPIPFLVDII